MSLNESVLAGLKQGARQAEEATRLKNSKPAPPFRGYLILEGDSWFSYPIYDEVTEKLREEYGYKTRSAAHPGDTAQEMSSLPKQLSDFEEQFADLASDKHKARAILLSGGGNDVMGVLSALMNAKGSPSGLIWHPDVVQAVIGEQVPFAIGALVAKAVWCSQWYFKEKRPILLHGYGNPVPDGRGFKFGFTWSGPWLKPVFVNKGYASSVLEDDTELAANRDAMAALILIFNETLARVVDDINGAYGETVAYYVDVRSALTTDLPDAYKDDWGNELHPTGEGFHRVAALIHNAIVSVTPQWP